MRGLALLFRCLALVLVLAASANAEERIQRFVSDVSVERDGTLDVTETIRINVERDQVRHGILRDIPTIYRDRRGATVQVGLKVVSVERDGAGEPYDTEQLGNGIRIRIGSADALVPYGPQDYVIRYRTTRQLGYFSDFDELYWNATGNQWTFPIDTAQAIVRLPDPVAFVQTAFYTGPQGARGQDARIVSREPGQIVFETTAPLPPGSGLTIAVAWPKGVVTPPGPARRALWWIEDNLGAMAAIIGTIIGIAYFIVAWNKVGRDPPRGTLVPLFSPPQGLSAPATRYIAEMDFDDRTFTSAILDLGVHRRLRLADDGRTLTLSRLEGGAAVDTSEEAMQAALFRRGVAVPLKQAQHAILAEAKSALNSGLQRAYAGTLFHWNGGWLAVGILVTAVAYGLTILALIAAMGPEAGVQAAVGLVFSSVAGVVIGIAIHQGRSGASLFSRIGIWLFMGLFALGFGGAGIGAFVTTIRSRLDLAALLLPFVLLPVLVSAFSWMRSPTAEGQKIRDAIEGFRHYLGIAEEHRLDILHPPEKTPELFERYLPYAVALDVENAWAAKFAGILASAGATAAVAQWYVTSANRDVGSLANRLGSSLSQTVASASTAPGSSSGSGGGGSSGGGGGGGGGSGW
ncbi:putative membrane protein YgcG [Kaistia hirudinis]|uniref:Putative membrane protein YgcG n=1 Tax=Kaistia hirudinis TaxID=1293440 RepID=A0A840AVM4_9HYPH|nr:DUF2207 domain-containing protein [Kaistia hirudinis]MBB3933218.1 putative membrane protein YgcG [Kaistia hirudinis]